MNFVQMRAFNAVARHGGISAAAQDLGVSKPAVTMQIKALEEAFGRPLFLRKGHAMELSELGRKLLQPVRTIARILDEIETMEDNSHHSTGGFLRVGACAPFILVPIVADFAKRFPSIHLETEISNSESLAEGVLSHDLDLAMATLKAPRPEFFNLCLTTQSVRAVVSVGHPWAGRSKIRIGDLEGAACVMREEGSMTRSILEDALAEHGVSIQPSVDLRSREAVKEAVACGLGIGFVLDREVGRDPHLVALEITGADLSAGEYLYCQRDLAHLSSIRAFIEVASEVHGLDNERPSADEAISVGD